MHVGNLKRDFIYPLIATKNVIKKRKGTFFWKKKANEKNDAIQQYKVLIYSCMYVLL